ncbi:MAG: site-specific integrase, partial [Butyrivibrio sp.]|nr:site-specific integrase [Butyrivibrio sp.]
METLKESINNYLEYCKTQKRLDEKTLKAYRIDLWQFNETLDSANAAEITPEKLEHYIAGLHAQYKPKTVKRKIASVKALFHYLEYKDVINKNPFNKIQIHFREPVILPKTIPLSTVEIFLSTIYKQRENAQTPYRKRNALRDAAVAELLFA